MARTVPAATDSCRASQLIDGWCALSHASRPSSASALLKRGGRPLGRAFGLRLVIGPSCARRCSDASPPPQLVGERLVVRTILVLGRRVGGVQKVLTFEAGVAGLVQLGGEDAALRPVQMFLGEIGQPVEMATREQIVAAHAATPLMCWRITPSSR